VPALRNVLSDENLDLRLNAAKALWQVSRQPDDVIPVFTQVLENGGDSERCDAAERLKEMGPWAAPAVPALVNVVKNDPYEYARCEAAEALGEIGPKAAPAIPALATVLEEDESHYVPARAAETLGKIGDPKAIPILIAALENEEDYVRTHALWALETFGPKAKAAIPTLVRALKNDEGNASFVAHALGAIDAEGISTPVLIEALGNEDSEMRRFAAFGLSRIGRKAGAAEKALHHGLRDTDLGARIAAAEAYWSVSGKADEAVGALRSVLQTPSDWLVQMWAAGALAEIGPAAKAAVPELIAALKSDTRYVVSSSAEALGKIGPDAASAVPALAARLEQCDDDYIRVCLARALWRINRSERSLPLLRDALRDSRGFMAVSQAVEALGEMGPKAKESVPLLRSLLTYSDRPFRDSVAKALAQIEKE
jgi:HEAT repeat protein